MHIDNTDEELGNAIMNIHNDLIQCLLIINFIEKNN